MKTCDTLFIDKKDLGTKYKEIGRGSEGTVYNYQNKYAIKLFTYYKKLESPAKLTRKMRKVEDMTTLEDPSCAFPEGIVSTDGTSLEGYYTKLIQSRGDISSFSGLRELKDLRRVIRYLQEGDKALQRFHEKGIILGDIKGNNILIDENDRPVYIDTDNFKFKNHTFDMIPERAGCLYSMFSGPITAHQDNDKLVYSIMAMRYLTKDENFSFYADKETIQYALRRQKMDRETRGALECIFSDATDKPYIGEYLSRVK